MTEKLTVAVLGTGRMARVHLEALARLRDAGLKAGGATVRIEPVLYGRDAAKVADLGGQHGIARASTNLDEILDAPDVDVVDNCLVNALHHRPLLRAIAHRKHVYSEKPLTTNLDEAGELLAAARAAGVHHGVVQNMRFNPGPRMAKRLLDEGFVGRIFSARIVFGYMVPQTVVNRPTWFYKKELAGGGIVEDMMAHFFDLLRFLVGPIATVYCKAATAWDERREPDGTPFKVEVEDLASVVIGFQNGAIADCFASWVRRKHEEVPSFEIDGEKGSLLFSFNRLRAQAQDETPIFRFDARKVQTESEADWREMPLELRDPFGLQIEEFLAGIVTGQPTKPDWQDAVTNLRLIRAAYQSLAEGREVRFSEAPEEVSHV